MGHISCGISQSVLFERIRECFLALGISLSTETVRTQFISIKNTLICPNFCRTVGNLSVSVQEREPLSMNCPC